MLIKARPDFFNRYSLIIFSFILLQGMTGAQNKGEVFYVTLPGSKLWIEGTSTINDYTCASGQVEGYAEIINSPDLTPGTIKKDKVIVSIAVRTLDCGNNTMNKDMYNAMKADAFPEIKYELVYARASARRDSSNRIILHTLGNMFIAGKEKLENIKIIIEKLSGGNFRLTGSFPVSMLDYGITPPQHLLGLIKAHEKLVVHFDLIIAEGKQRRITRD
jgi:hypothetical protein